MAEDKIDSLFNVPQINAEIQSILKSLKLVTSDLKDIAITSSKAFQGDKSIKDTQTELTKLNAEIEKKKKLDDELIKKQQELIALEKKHTEALASMGKEIEKTTKDTKYVADGYKDLKGKIKEVTTEIVALNSQNKRLTEENKKLSKELENGTITKRQYTEAIEKNNIAVASNKINLGELRTEQKRLLKEQESAPGSLNQLSNAYDRLNSQYIKLSAEEKRSPVGVKMREDLKKLSNELKIQEEQIGRTQRNVGNYGTSLKNIGASVLKFASALGLVVGAQKAFTFAFDGMKSASQSFGDGYKEIMTGAKESTDAFFRTVASGDWSNLIDNMKEAYEAGVEYAEMLDLISDLKRAGKYETAEIDKEIAKQQELMRNRLLGAEVNKKALLEIERLEKQKLNIRQDLAERDIQVEVDLIRKTKTLTEKELRAMFGSRENQLLMAQAKERKIKIEALADEFYRQDKLTGIDVKTKEQHALEILHIEQKTWTEKEKLAYFYNKRQDGIEDKQRDKIINAFVEKENAEKDYNIAIASMTRQRNRIYNELASDEKARQDEINKAKKEGIEFEKEKIKLTNEALLIGEKDGYEIKKKEITDLWELDKKLLKEKTNEYILAEMRKNNQLLALEKEHKENIKTIKETDLQTSSEYLDLQFAEEEAILKEAYSLNGYYLGRKIDSEKAYQEELAKIKQAQLISEIAMLEGVEGKEEELARKKIELQNAVSQARIDATKQETKEAKKQTDTIKEYLEYAREVASLWGDMMQISKNKSQQEIDNLEEETKAKIRNLETQGLSEEMYNEKVRALNDQLEEKKRQNAIKDAERQKQMAIIMAGINASLAITSIWAQPPPKTSVQKLIETLFVGAKLATEIGMIKSAPIPKYAKGREGGKGEVAYVGEQGSELVYGKGFAYLTPPKATLTYLPSGASVLPAKDTKSLLSGEYNGYFSELINAVKSKENSINITEKGIYTLAKKGTNRVKYLNTLKQ